MSGPRFDEIEGEEDVAPSFDAIEGDEVAEAAPPTSAAPVAPDGPVLRAPERTAWNTIRDVAEASGTVPRGIIPSEGTARGAVASILQGPALNWADEIAGQLSENEALLRYMREGGQKPNPEQTYLDGRDAFRDVEGAFRTENPAAAFTLTTIGGLAAPAPGSSSLSFGTRVAGAGLTGGIAGAGAAAEAEDIPMAATAGAPLAMGGQAGGEVVGELAGEALGRIGDAAGRRVAAAETKAQQMAADKVASAIASAKGKLGATTQEANRAVENLLRLQQVGGLSAQQQQELALLQSSGVLSALHQKLADSMLDQVPNAANRITQDKLALTALVQDAPQATAAAADDILSGAEAKRQVGERVKRYLPTVVGALGGAAPAGAAGYMLGGSMSDALIGGLAGAGIRPALRAGQRMLAHPSVQRGLYSPVERVANASAGPLGEAITRLGPAAAYAQRNEAEAPERRDTTSSSLVEGVVSSNPEALGPYAQQLQQAVVDGNLPIVHYSLQQKDPQYRRMLDGLREGGTQ